MEEEKIIQEKSGKKGLVVTFVLILCLAVIALASGLYLYFQDKNPKDIYFGVIDSVVEDLTSSLDNMDDLYDSPYGSDFEITANFKSNNADYKGIEDIINKLKITTSLEADFKAQKENLNLKVLYDNQNLASADLIVKDNAIYANLNDIYDKSIKLPVDNLDQVWKMSNTKDYETIVKEFRDILKNNLKDEYFTKEDQKITVNKEEVSTVKYVMTLTSKDLQTLSNGVLNDIKENTKIIDALVNLTGTNKEDIINSLNEEITFEEEFTLVSEIYVNKYNKNVERVVIKDDASEITFNRTQNEKYEISLTEDNNSVVVGTLKVDDNLELNIDYDGVKIEFKLSETIISISIEETQNIMELYFNTKDENIDGYLKLVVESEDIELLVNIDGKIKDINSVSEKSVSNYIELDKMTDDDYNNIMQNLYENETILTLVQDIMTMGNDTL